jgi:hypothetical protein
MKIFGLNNFPQCYQANWDSATCRGADRENGDKTFRVGKSGAIAVLCWRFYFLENFENFLQK